METLAVTELERLDPSLDLFEDGPGIDALLLEQGLHPPLPVSDGALVWGFTLLRQARRTHHRELPCRVLPPLPAAERLATALRLEGRAGRYSWGERERMLRFVRERRAAGEEIELGSLSPWIEGRSDPGLEGRIGAFAELPPAARQAVAAGRLDLKAAALAADLPPEVFAALERGRSSGAPSSVASLSFARRRQFLLQLREVARRDRLDPAALTALAEELLRREDPLEALNARRFPTLTALRKRFAALEDSLWKGSGVRIQPPRYFEGGDFAVEFRFASRQDLQRKLRALEGAAEHCDELFELLR
ncbi:MAG: hypothetical protein JW820_15665 [Spirochaetales bacterium]|nr:hypothetical protein [Spirochaetales bacterium]